MKRLFTLIMAYAAVLGLNAQVQWLESSHNFGAFEEEDGPQTHSFRYVNCGSEPVAIVSAHASCGCTVPQYSRNAVAPGDTAAITVTYDPTARPGKFQKSVTVQFSDAGPKHKLYVSGTVIGDPETVAQRFPHPGGEALRLARPSVMVGEAVKGHLRTASLLAYNASEHPVTPVFTASVPYIEVTATPATVPPGEQVQFMVFYKADKCPSYGFVADTLYLSGDGSDVVDIPVTAIVKEDFSKLTPGERINGPQLLVEDAKADFGTLGSESVSRSITIKNIGKAPLMIRRAYSMDPGIDVELSSEKIKPGRSADITVTVDPSKITGAILNAEITLITNDPSRPTSILRAVGLIKKQ